MGNLRYLLLIIIVFACTKTQRYIIYGKVMEDPDMRVFSEKGLVEEDYLQVYFLNWVPRLDASMASIDDGVDKQFLTLVYSHSPDAVIWFQSPGALIKYFKDRGWRYEGIDNFVINKKMHSARIFRREEK